MARPKVLHIITRLDRGGSAEAVMQLVEGLKRDGYPVKLVTGRTVEPQEDLDAFSRRTGVPVVSIEELRREVNPVDDLIALVKLMHLIGRERPEIVHTHSSKAGLLGRLAARLMDCPLIIHFPHGHVFYGYFGRLRTWTIILAERLAARITHRIFTLTELGKRDHIRFGIAKPEKFVTIPCGIDVAKFSSAGRNPAEARAGFGFSPSDVVAGYVGRLVAIKGCEYFLYALELVRKKRSDIKGIIVGDGPLRKELEELAKGLDLSESVVFAGAREDIPEVMHALDLFVLTSLNEGLGRVLLEAMACGVPVVASRVGGVAEIVLHRETGLLVPPENPEGIAEAILEILNDKKKAELFSRKGKERTKLFDVRRMIERTEEIYQRLLVDREGGRG